MMLPFIPIGILIYSLDRFTGIDEALRNLIAVVLVAATLLLFFLSLYLELSKGNIEHKRIRLRLGNSKFGIAEIARVLFSFVIIAFIYVGSDFAIMSLRLGRVVHTIAAPPPEASIQRAYSLVTMSNFDIENQGGYGRVGVLPATNEEMDLAVEEFLYEQNFIINPIQEFFETPVEMISALYDNEISAMIISSNFAQVFDDLERFENISDETIVLREFDIEIERADREDIDPGEPFSILLMGLNQNDQALTSGAINTFMLLTVNLEELSFTITSIPRDSYVWVPCLPGYVYDKLSHTNLGGPACAISTIEQMFDMEIPYYVTLNFTGFMSIIDVLGGIEVDVPFAFYEQDSRRRFGDNVIRLEAGLQRLNAEEALALTRHRNSRGTGTMEGDDFTRVQHQQLVFQAMLREMFNQVDHINDILPLLEVIGQHVDTNLRPQEIMTIGQYMLSLLQGRSGANLMHDMHFINMVILGTTEQIQVRHYGELWVSHPWQDRIAEARRLMMINLGLAEPEFTFNFEFDGFIRPTRQWGESNGTHVGGEWSPAYPTETTPPVETPPPVYTPAPAPPPPPPAEQAPPQEPVNPPENQTPSPDTPADTTPPEQPPAENQPPTENQPPEDPPINPDIPVDGEEVGENVE